MIPWLSSAHPSHYTDYTLFTPQQILKALEQENTTPVWGTNIMMKVIIYTAFLQKMQLK
jgi:hypothetical protein